ncbi:sulfite exporter TauE/SafE family protein [Metabacillus bambusae]|uniref:Probable membrane transporter protein n=1 Tax=Metabacillus bambusae TaxID=2795218 RepID=A0ABS3MYD7_9BACI|nr:sulfite exporter TauE/SafE family protein [Metabacillus bambusae]MBO1510879.1 sulfite exporter TauE/SafE family protein [Metabacillus bambusae]
MEWITLVVVGVIAGTIGSLVGLGGGIIVVPLLLTLGSYLPTFESVSPQVAVGTSLLVVIFTGLSSTLTYMKYKKVDYKSGLIFFIGSGPGGIVGAYANKFFNTTSFSIWFGLFMILVSIILMVKDKLPQRKQQPGIKVIRSYISENGTEISYSFHPGLGVLIAFVVGFISGLFGIGGGALMVPAMILLFMFPPHIAVATSMFIIFLSASTSSITHIALGNINWLYAAVLIPGAWFGGRFGAVLNTKLKGKTIVNLLRIVLIIAGLKLIFEGFTGS